MTDKNFYASFTDRHRGSRELIKSRLETDYLRFIRPLRSLYPDGRALDLGSGRGEWLEMLAANGFSPRGIDLDDVMLAACRERGFTVEKQDAVGALAGFADESLAIVSAFHLVEHLPLETVQPLLQEALRVLKPGGLLILETPNPENILVSTTGFFMDPTHQRPIPMYLLAFLSEYSGFARTKMLRLHESSEITSRPVITLPDVLGGVSPDYAIVAQKAGSEEQMAITAAPFALDTGVTLEMLAAQYERQTESRIEQAESRIAQTEFRIAQAESRIVQAESRATKAEMEQQALYASRSWRITKPLRSVASMVRHLRGAAGVALHKIRQRLKSLVLFVLSGPFHFVRSHHAIRQLIVAWVDRFPRLEAQLRHMAAFIRQAETSNQISVRAEELPPPLHVRRIQAELIAAIERRNNGND